MQPRPNINLLIALALGSACTSSSRAPENEPPLPACPGDGELDADVPLFPGTVIRTRRGTTRGHMDVDTYVADVAAPFARVRDFYVQCLGSEALAGERSARFARPVTGSRWEPGSGPIMPEGPRDMADTVTLNEREDGTTTIFVSIAMPYGRGRAPPGP